MLKIPSFRLLSGLPIVLKLKTRFFTLGFERSKSFKISSSIMKQAVQDTLQGACFGYLIAFVFFGAMPQEGHAEQAKDDFRFHSKVIKK
jgi:hypothetical protein